MPVEILPQLLQYALAVIGSLLALLIALIMWLPSISKKKGH